MEKKTDIFEQLADDCFARFKEYDINTMLQTQTVTELSKLIAGSPDSYDNTLQARIVEMVVYNRIKDNHYNAIIRF
jgi:hypothetical protein